MYSIHLEIFREIEGIGSASGIVHNSDLLYIIGDNSGFLNEYTIKTQNLRKIQMLSSTSEIFENIPKSQKPDFEVLCKHANHLYVLGSGSTDKRNSYVEFNIKSNRFIIKDLTATYRNMMAFADIDHSDFNIEGAVFTGEYWVLFNRGNGKGNKNGMFRVRGKDLAKNNNIEFIPQTLPYIKQVQSSFTDAVIVNTDIFFISSSEDTKSTFADGEILGSFIGSINLKTLKLNFTYRIPGLHKFEGISLYQTTKNSVEFLLCEDKDIEDLKTTIYKLRMIF